MRRRQSSILALITTVLVAACGSSADGEGGQKPNADVEQRIASVKSMLKDPYSARFTNLSLKDEVLGYKGSSGLLSNSGELVFVKDLTLCGEVNAKNSVGAYIGPRPFAASTERTLIYQDVAEFDSFPLSSGSEAMVGWLKEQAATREAQANNRAISDACSSSGTPVMRPDDVS